MDTATQMANLDSLIARFFGAFDNRNGRITSCADIANLFIENAVILHEAGGEIAALTITEFTEPRVALLTSGTLQEFHEWETASTTNIFGRFAVRTSEYSKSGILDSLPYEGRGTKLFQLTDLGGYWRIASLCWYDSKG